MRIALAWLLVLVLSVISLPGVATAADPAPAAAARPEGAPEPGRAIRLVGDAAVKPTLEGDQYRLPEAGVGVEAPLPEGYPAPTPPGMIELKTYPLVRRAERSSKGSSDMGMVTSFFPLFNHIKKRQIAMTSPVEMDYRSGDDGKPLAAQPIEDCEWTVSFLYRTPDLGPAGADGNVQVVDVPEVVVVSIGMNDGYGSATVAQGLESLQTWFDGQDAWEPAGDPRTLMYNGPGAPFRQPWSEVQVPVRRKKPADPARGQGGSSLDNGEVGKEWALDIGDGQKLRVCYCPAGRFMMGTPAGEVRYVEPRETPVEVTLTAAFWLSRTEVTQAQWVAVMGRNPSGFKGANLPVDTVSWDDCQEFIRRLNARGGLPAGWTWALPTEAQWEYACRAGEKGPYSGGTLDAVGWYLDNADGKTHEVAMKKPNAWGLHDMHGNVLEWCADWMGESLPGGMNPRGPDACAFGDFRVLRGGSWDRPPQACRAAIRFWSRDGGNRTGFRPALVPF